MSFCDIWIAKFSDESQEICRLSSALDREGVFLNPLDVPLQITPRKQLFLVAEIDDGFEEKGGSEDFGSSAFDERFGRPRERLIEVDQGEINLGLLGDFPKAPERNFADGSLLIELTQDFTDEESIFDRMRPSASKKGDSLTRQVSASDDRTIGPERV
jgi:hypothetical protein|tara:strand:- start:943 stop:1416 length:474 start_codon:yes stop_codon:yes gene_type:complete